MIATYTLPAARDFVFVLITTFRSIHLYLFSKSSPHVLTALLLVSVASSVGPQNIVAWVILVVTGRFSEAGLLE